MSNYKKGYSYDFETKELIGEEVVYQEKATGEYPHAKNVTLTPPPAAEPGKTVLYVAKNDGWELVEDHRGEMWYKPDGNEGGIIEKIGKCEQIIKKPPQAAPGSYIEWSGEDWIMKPEDGFIQDGGQFRAMTQDELLEAGKITLEQYNDHQRKMREAEYKTSTDKIGLMVLRGEATQEEWQEALQAVKEKWPYKE